MVSDGDMIAAYLAAAAAGVGQGAPDRTVESLLDQLLRKATRGIGRSPVDRLAHEPNDRAALHEAGLLIDGAMSRDPSFAQEMTDIVAELERRGGRDVVNAVSAGYQMPGAVAYGAGMRGGVSPDGSRAGPTHLVHWSPLGYMPGWAKTLIGAGFVTFAAGFVVFAYVIFTVFTDTDGAAAEQGLPSGVALGFGVCFAGIVLAAIGMIGGQMRRRR